MLSASIVGVTETAHAGPDAHGQYPTWHSCNSNAALIATRPMLLGGQGPEVGVLEIYYSYSCQANWIRVRENPYGGETKKILNSDGMPSIAPEVDYGYKPSYTKMAYAPGSTCIDYQAWISDPTGYYVGYAGGRLC